MAATEVRKLLMDLDDIAVDYDQYEFGLPCHNPEWVERAARLIENLIARRIEAENYGGM